MRVGGWSCVLSENENLFDCGLLVLVLPFSLLLIFADHVFVYYRAIARKTKLPMLEERRLDSISWRVYSGFRSWNSGKICRLRDLRAVSVGPVKAQ